MSAVVNIQEAHAIRDQRVLGRGLARASKAGYCKHLAIALAKQYRAHVRRLVGMGWTLDAAEADAARKIIRPMSAPVNAPGPGRAA